MLGDAATLPPSLTKLTINGVALGLGPQLPQVDDALL